MRNPQLRLYRGRSMSDHDHAGDPATMLMPPMPESSEPIIEPGPPRADSDGGEGGEDRGLGLGPPDRKQNTIRRQMIDAEEGRAATRALAEETAQLQEAVDKFRLSNPAGYFHIHRIGPYELPQSERGGICKIKVIDLGERALEDEILKRLGGGEYRVECKRGNHTMLPGGIMEFTLAGEPKMISTTGKAWEVAARRAMGTAGDDSAKKENDSLMRTLIERVTDRPREGAGDSAMMMEFFKSMRESDERRDRQDREDRERREKADKEDKERREKIEKDDRDRRLKDEKEEKERREKADKDEREERSRRVEEQSKRDAAERSEQFKLRMKMIEDESAARLKQMELNAAGGVGGLDGLKKLKEAFVEIMVDDVREKVTSGGAVDAPEDWGSVVRSVAQSHGGELISKILDIVGTKAGAKPVVTPATHQLAETVPDISSDDAKDVDVELPQDENAETPAPGAAAAGQGIESESATPQEAMKTMAEIGRQKSVGRCIAFLKMLGSEMMAESDPAEAWVTLQDDDGNNLADVYASLAAPLREGLRTGWRAFNAAAHTAAPKELAVVNAMLGNPRGVGWMKTFLRSGPWNAQDDEIEDEAEVTASVSTPVPGKPSPEKTPPEKGAARAEPKPKPKVKPKLNGAVVPAPKPTLPSDEQDGKGGMA